MDKRRTGVFFFPDGELERERRIIEDYARSIAKVPCHVCDACGNLGGIGKWHCTHCGANFCYPCVKVFASFQNISTPDCPGCGRKMRQKRDLRPISDEQKIIRYISTTKVKAIRNTRDLFDRLSQLLHKDLVYVESVWSNLEHQYPLYIEQITSQFKDEVLKQHYQQLQYEALHPEHKNENVILPDSTKSKDDGKLNIKEIKPIDGLESEWKQGKMRPVDQKTYRSKFDEQ